MAKRPALKTNKNCLVCNEVFLGTEGKQTCSSRCRTKLARLKADKKKPEYMLIAKSKGQKIPDLSAPKRLYFRKGEKKLKTEEKTESVINFTPPPEKSFDGERTSRYVMDEVGLAVPSEPMDKFKIMGKITELERKITEIKGEPLPLRMLPKSHAMNKAMRIDTINEQINELKKQLL